MEALEQAGICLRLGWRQWGYIMKTDRVSELAEALEEIPGWFGIGYLEQAVSGGEIYDGLEECNRRAFQYFVDSKERICARPDEAKANRWLDSVQEKLHSMSPGRPVGRPERPAGGDQGQGQGGLYRVQRPAALQHGLHPVPVPGRGERFLCL